MDEFIHQQNLALLKKQLAEVKDEAKRNLIVTLLAEEQARNVLPTRS